MAHELTRYTKITNGVQTQNLTLGYNANGDRTSASDSVSHATITGGYDQETRLTNYTKGSTGAGYTYNGDGLRVSKTVNGVTTSFVWDLAEGMPLILQAGTMKYVTGQGGFVGVGCILDPHPYATLENSFSLHLSSNSGRSSCVCDLARASTDRTQSRFPSRSWEGSPSFTG